MNNVIDEFEMGGVNYQVVDMMDDPNNNPSGYSDDDEDVILEKDDDSGSGFAEKINGIILI